MVMMTRRKTILLVCSKEFRLSISTLSATTAAGTCSLQYLRSLRRPLLSRQLNLSLQFLLILPTFRLSLRCPSCPAVPLSDRSCGPAPSPSPIPSPSPPHGASTPRLPTLPPTLTPTLTRQGFKNTH